MAKEEADELQKQRLQRILDKQQHSETIRQQQQEQLRQETERLQLMKRLEADRRSTLVERQRRKEQYEKFLLADRIAEDQAKAERIEAERQLLLAQVCRIVLCIS